MWVRGSLANARMAKVARVTTDEWKAVKPVVLPLLANVRPEIAESLKQLRTFDGKSFRLQIGTWFAASFSSGMVTSARICSSHKYLEGDHILPLSRGGSNAFDNLATACRS